MKVELKGALWIFGVSKCHSVQVIQSVSCVMIWTLNADTENRD